MNLYSIDMRIAATAYIKANSAAEALRIAQSLKFDALELKEDLYQKVPITCMTYTDPDLPDVSLSPAMTIHGPWGGSVELVEENAPQFESEET